MGCGVSVLGWQQLPLSPNDDPAEVQPLLPPPPPAPPRAPQVTPIAQSRKKPTDIHSRLQPTIPSHMAKGKSKKRTSRPTRTRPARQAAVIKLTAPIKPSASSTPAARTVEPVEETLPLNPAPSCSHEADERFFCDWRHRKPVEATPWPTDIYTGTIDPRRVKGL